MAIYSLLPRDIRLRLPQDIHQDTNLFRGEYFAMCTVTGGMKSFHDLVVASHPQS